MLKRYHVLIRKKEASKEKCNDLKNTTVTCEEEAFETGVLLKQTRSQKQKKKALQQLAEKRIGLKLTKQELHSHFSERVMLLHK